MAILQDANGKEVPEFTVPDGYDVTQGVTTGAAVVTDAAGTIQQYLRGLVKLIVAKIAVTVGSGGIASGAIASGAVASGAIASGAVASGAVASGAIASGAVAAGAVSAGAVVAGALVDGADLTQGVTTGAAVITDAAGTIQQYLRGLVKLIAGILSVKIDQTTPGTTDRVTAGGKVVTVTVTPTLTVAGAYGANDFVGTSATGMTFANAVRVNAGSGVIESATLVDYALQSAALELWLFDVTPAGLPADNAAFTITDAAALTCIGVIPFSTYYASALNSVSVAKGLGMAFNAVGAVTAIYGALVTRGTPTYASGDISIRLQIMCD